MDRNIYQVQKPLPPAVAVNPNQATVQQPPNAFSLSRCPRIRGRSWCGLQLKTGAKIISYLSFIGNILGCAGRIAQWVFIYSTLLKNKNRYNVKTALDDFGAMTCIGTVVMGLIVIICSVIMLIGAYRVRKMFLIPWLISDMLLRFIHVLSIIYSAIAYAHFSNMSKPKFDQYSKDTQSKSWFSSFLSEEKQDEQRINDFFSQLELDELSRLIFLESVLINIFIIISCSIGIGFGMYMWYIVFSFFLEVDENEKRRMAPNSYEMRYH